MLYSASGINAHQLDSLAHVNLFTAAITSQQRSHTLFSLADNNATLAQRARSYLHSNCSNCHRVDGSTSVTMDLHYSIGLAATGTCDVQPAAGDLGVNNARIIAPGEPERSVLLARMKVRDVNQMPPLASHVVDEAAVAVIVEWITELNGCE